MTFPSLVIAGAPKCGTSSLFRWLADHPQVCGSRVKEPFFLMDADSPLRRSECNVHDHGLDAYSSFFPDCTESDRIAIEATTHYIYQTTALDVLEGLGTRPRIVFLLRRPSERIYSSFIYSKARGNVRRDLSFSEYVKLVGDGTGGALDGLAWGPSAYVLERDIRYSRYVDYLTQWRDRLGDERMRVVLFETMRADPKGTMQELCGWAGIDPSFYDDYDFAARNRTVAVRSPRVQKLARALASKFPAGRLKNGIERLYYALQARPRTEQRTPADEAALAALDAQFRPFNDRLAREFGLDLTAWEQQPPASSAAPGSRGTA